MKTLLIIFATILCSCTATRQVVEQPEGYAVVKKELPDKHRVYKKKLQSRAKKNREGFERGYAFDLEAIQRQQEKEFEEIKIK